MHRFQNTTFGPEGFKSLPLMVLCDVEANRSFGVMLLCMTGGQRCRVLLDSFISTQKLSVQKTLQRKFKRFVSYKRDFQELLLSALQGLVREQIRYEACSGAAPASEAVVSVPTK